MKIKALFESALTGVVTALLSYYVLITPATLAALRLRRKMPDASLSSMITWYAAFGVIGVSLVLAGVACRLVYRHVAGSPTVQHK
jgi:hypothetical protein